MKQEGEKIPLESVVPAATVNPDRVRQYAGMDSSTQPPIEVHGGHVFEGNHRWFASLSRGDTEILARESNLLPEAKKRRLKMFGR